MQTEVRFYSSDDPAGENAVQYSFTGKRTFWGWPGQGGRVDNPVPGDFTGSSWNLGQGGMSFDPINNDYQSKYNDAIDYSADFRNGCCDKDHGYNAKWPGVKMKRDEENPGWFYYDLPALANPGTTLIMFADVHSISGSGIDDQHRYPAAMVPGVPLYDFADKEGWFLYEYNNSNNEFVDDKPGIADQDLVVYRIWINDTSYDKIHVWKSSPYREWDHTDAWIWKDKSGKRYYDLYVTRDWISDGTISYLYYNNGGKGQTENRTISSSEWRLVTGQSYQYEVTR